MLTCEVVVVNPRVDQRTCPVASEIIDRFAF